MGGTFLIYVLAHLPNPATHPIWSGHSTSWNSVMKETHYSRHSQREKEQGDFFKYTVIPPGARQDPEGTLTEMATPSQDKILSSHVSRYQPVSFMIPFISPILCWTCTRHKEAPTIPITDPTNAKGYTACPHVNLYTAVHAPTLGH